MPTKAAKHKSRPTLIRRTANERGYNYRWQRESKLFLAEHPLCEECRRRDIITAASCVDHVEPHRGDYERFWQVSNWQALCHSCHSRKTALGK